MNWKVVVGGLGLGVGGVVLVVLVLVVAAIGGIWWFVTDDSPLLYYDARPALVDDVALAETGYVAVNDTAFNLSYAVIPFVGRDVRVRSWVSVYAGGIDVPDGTATGSDGTTTEGDGTDDGGEGPLDPRAPVPGPPAVGVGNASFVTVFSMSALQAGPVALNPVVYATDPGLLDESGVLLDRAETYLPRDVTDVTNVDVRSSRDVRLLGRETELTTFTGELALADPTGETVGVEVDFYLARVVRDGELVVVLGVAPQQGGDETAFATLVEHVRMGEWGATPGWNRPTAPTPPGPFDLRAEGWTGVASPSARPR
jgi:hypothetical protein